MALGLRVKLSVGGYNDDTYLLQLCMAVLMPMLKATSQWWATDGCEK